MDSGHKPSTSGSSLMDRALQAQARLGLWMDARIPENLLADPESARRARLIAQFGVQGTFFGLTYALFYLVIGHLWGTGIILLCTLGVMLTPSLMRWEKSVTLAGNFFSLTLVLGFFGLCFVEGGVHGHAIAWLVSVPLCALLLLGVRGAIRWVIISLLAAGVIVGFDLAGVELPITYPPQWIPIVSGTGYLGLGFFMFMLGLIFENGRAQSFARMQVVLRELATTNEKLTAINQDKNEFLGIAAHDLKNPLTSILANGELLKIIDDPKRSKALAETIVSASERMRHIITNLLDVHAIEEGAFASQFESCNLSELVTQSVEHNLQPAHQKQIILRAGVIEEIRIQTDPNATLQILDNLISNAVKYSPLHTTVEIDLRSDEQHALVCVRDHGPGISADDQKKLFQKFSRLTARPTAGESSNGLGLAIAKRLAEAMSGTVQCESQLGKGTTFTLKLPLGLSVAGV